LRGQANTEGLLGMVARLTGEYPAAPTHFHLALQLFTERNCQYLWIKIFL
jgi:hypothetical protein